MLIKLKDISESPSDFSFRLSRDVFLRLGDRLRFGEMSCEANLRRSQDIVVLKGSYKVNLRGECDFCLAATVLNMEQCFELTLIPDIDKEVMPENDMEISLNTPDVEYYRGMEISLDRHFEDQLLLDLPMSISCSEECKGICCGCGVNLNDEPCQCKRYLNNPFYVLSQLEK